MWHNLALCNADSADIMPMWSTCAANPNDVMSGVHGMCAQASQLSLTHHDLLIDLACVCADCQLLEITTLHFWELITQNANRNMTMMVLIE